MGLHNAESAGRLRKLVRIAIVGATPPPYMGPTVMTKKILESDLRSRFDLIHVDTSDHRSVDSTNKFDFTNIILGLWHPLKLAYTLWKKKPHILYVLISQTAIGYFRDSLYIILGVMFRSRIIVHLRGGEFDQFYDRTNSLVKWLIRYTLSKVDRVIVLGNCLRRLFYRFISPDIIEVVPNGIEDILEDAISTKSDTHEDRILVVWLSTLSLRKGLMEVIKSVPIVTERNEKVRYVFAGHWFREEYKKKALQLVEQKKLWDYVEFPGRVTGKEKTNLLMSGDIFVLPPLMPEGHPVSILEAMSVGLPVIATDQGCITETVIHGQNGFIVEPGNEEELANRILQLVEDVELRKKMSKNSRERYLELYTVDVFINNLGDVFARAAGNLRI